MITDLTDEQLLQEAVAGDSEAFGIVVRRWERKIFALCFGMLMREEDAHDAVQETFVAAFRHVGSFRGEARVSSWLHRIAVNQCLTIMRRTKTRSELLLDDENASEHTVFVAPLKNSPLNTSEVAERNELVRQAVLALPEELRQVIVMKEFEEMTFQEISDVLQLPLSTVKSRLYTALKQLRRKLENRPLEVV